MFTKEDIKSLSDDQLIAIANVIEKRDDWQVNRHYADELGLYEIISPEISAGMREAIVQVNFGDRWDGENPRTAIEHFDIDLFDSMPNAEEIVVISKIILG